jgi:hypothetical protein
MKEVSMMNPLAPNYTGPGTAAAKPSKIKRLLIKGK